MFKKIVLLFGLFALMAIFFGCAQRSSPVEKPTSPEAKPQAPIQETWEAEWERVLKEARKEGSVTVYTPASPELRAALSEAMKEYGITVEIVSGRGVEIAEKILRERRAGIYNADLYGPVGLDTFVNIMKPAGVLVPLEPLLILPEVKDPKVWYKGKLPFADKERKIFAFEAYVDHGIHINTDMVKPLDITSMQDLLSPRWKGKILVDDPTIPGRAQNWLVIVAVKLGEDYLKQLAKQEPLLTRDRTLMLNWLARGRYPIGIGVRPDHYQEYKRAGAPINNLVLKEVSYLLSGSAYISNVDKAPHPNAYRVFINWLLSRKGQILWTGIRTTQSARIDTPLDHLIKTGQPVRQPNIDYYDNIDEEWQIEVKPPFTEMVIDIFKSLTR